MRILLAGGGTGGHLYPVLSLARALSGAPADPGLCKPGETMPQIELGLDLHDGAPTLLFVSSTGALDAGMLADARIPTATVASSPLSRTSVFSAAAVGLAGNAVGVAQALPLVARFRPDVIIASGGYASVPVVTAAAMLRVARRLPGLKIALIEPNALPGVANRALSRAADEVWGAYADTAVYFPGKFVKTGVPVRPEFYAPVAKADARKRLGLDPDPLDGAGVRRQPGRAHDQRGGERDGGPAAAPARMAGAARDGQARLRVDGGGAQGRAQRQPLHRRGLFGRHGARTCGGGRGRVARGRLNARRKRRQRASRAARAVSPCG